MCTVRLCTVHSCCQCLKRVVYHQGLRDLTHLTLADNSIGFTALQKRIPAISFSALHRHHNKLLFYIVYYIHIAAMNRLIGALSCLLICIFSNVYAFTATSSSLVQYNSRSPSIQKNINTIKTSLQAGPLEVMDPSYNLALGSLALGAAFGVPGSPLKSKLSSFIGGIPLLLFGLFLVFQTTTLRFTFDDDNFSLVKSNGESLGENVVVGGENVWAYDKFVNYDLL